MRPILSRSATLPLRHVVSESSLLGSAGLGQGKEECFGLIQVVVIGFLLSWTYFTYSDVLLFDETSPNVFYVKNAVPV